MLFADTGELLRSGFRPRVTIVGTGPAGLSLALRLQSKRVPCLLIEAGGFDCSGDTDDAYNGVAVGDPYYELHAARAREFGGTSSMWSGWVVPLDESDFAASAWMPDSGWPIGKGDLDPFAAAADEILEVAALREPRPATRDIDFVHFRFSAPVRFGTKYRGEVERSKTIGLLLNTAVKEVVPGKGRVAAVRIVESGRREHDLAVDTVCLCTGGIENNRLLLWSNWRYEGRVVPHAAALGRYWMDQPLLTIGDAVTFDGYESRYKARSAEKWYFAPSHRAKRMHGIGGSHMWMPPQYEIADKGRALAHEFACMAPELSNRLLKLAGREWPCGGALVRTEIEQWPRAENRVELAREVDSLGVPLGRLHWKKSDAERRTALLSARLLGEALIRQDIGRLRIRNYLLDDEPWPASPRPTGYHHMGGTRMAHSPATGVVDRNCQVFGMANLFIGGSSVFPTCGHANPTYTIVQLALRLGDHIASGV